jgi:hypothetical protein
VRKTWGWVLAVAGCEAPGDGNQTGEVAATCCECGERTPLSLDEPGPGGFSGQDAVSSGPLEGQVSWIDGVQDTIRFAFVADEESTGNLSWTEPDEPACEPFLTVPIWLEVTTDDGALAESLRTELLATAADRYIVRIDQYGSSLQGTLDLERFVPGLDPEVARVFFQLEREAVASGNIDLDPQDELDDSWDGAQPIATWSE